MCSERSSPEIRRDRYPRPANKGGRSARLFPQVKVCSRPRLTDVQTPDELLVRRAREGDGPAREELFLRHRNDAYWVAYRYLGHEQDALDVVQESMLKAFSALATSTAAAVSGPGS